MRRRRFRPKTSAISISSKSQPDVTEETTIQRLSTEGADMLTLAGVNDENLIELAKQTGAKIALRGETLAVSGGAEAVARAVPIAQRMIDTAKQQMPLTADDVLRMSIEAPREGNGAGSAT